MMVHTWIMFFLRDQYTDFFFNMNNKFLLKNLFIAVHFSGPACTIKRFGAVTFTKFCSDDKNGNSG